MNGTKKMRPTSTGVGQRVPPKRKYKKATRKLKKLTPEARKAFDDVFAEPTKFYVQQAKYKKFLNIPFKAQGPEPEKEFPFKGVLYTFCIVNETNGKRQELRMFREHFKCEYCDLALSFKTLYGLLNHLKNEHSKFRFSFVPPHRKTTVAKVYVTINKDYDDSKDEEMEIDDIGKNQLKLSASGSFSLDQFIDYAGHQRRYINPFTGLLLGPNEFEYDSALEFKVPGGFHPTMSTKIDMKVEKEHYVLISDGDKEFLKIWNTYVYEHHSKALDHHKSIHPTYIPTIVKSFVDARGKELMAKNLIPEFKKILYEFLKQRVIGREIISNAMKRVWEMQLTKLD